MTDWERRSIRVRGYDYGSAGAYFVTICTHEREILFGAVADGRMTLNEYGHVAEEEWLASEEIRREIELDEFVIMPNHMHGIVWIHPDEDVLIAGQDVGATGRSPLRGHERPRGPTPRSLGSFIAGFKSAVTKRINAIRGTPGAPVWQRNYWEHVVRSERALDAIRRYVRDNPARWSLDRYNPVRTGPDQRAADLWRLLREDAV